MKKRYRSLAGLIAIVGALSATVKAQVSVTANNTGEQPGTWSGKKWNYVTGHVVWAEQNSSAVHVSCRAVLDCSLAVGTLNGNKFYPNFGFVRINNGSSWEQTYASWRNYHGTEATFKYMEQVERLTAPGACTLVGLYWGKDEDGGYQNWLPVPESHCAPISGL